MNAAQAGVEDLVLGHLALVGYHVNEVLHRVPPSVSRDDLASAGSLALVLAAQSYDASSGVPFARYAALRIKGMILDELRAMDWASRGARRRAREYATASEQLRASMGRQPTREELASALGTDVSGVDEARLDAERRVLRLDAPGSVLADVVPDPAATPEDELLSNERVHWLRAAVTTLPERLRFVIVGLYLEDRSIASMAAELSVTESRISQLRTEALGLLRDGMNASLDPGLVPAAQHPGGVAERRRRAYFAAVAARAAMPAATTAASGDVPQPRRRAAQTAGFSEDQVATA
ncbi:MAG TPA: sigma-70 family RNA polymerase sigma factor [Cellulomonas sp.]